MGRPFDLDLPGNLDGWVPSSKHVSFPTMARYVQGDLPIIMVFHRNEFEYNSPGKLFPIRFSMSVVP